MNLEPRCMNCAYWGRVHPEHGYGMEDNGEGNLRLCACPKFRLGYHYRDRDFSSDSDEVHVENDEGWGFTTGPLFGCVHFARKAL